jgi:hypothetical protein
MTKNTDLADRQAAAQLKYNAEVAAELVKLTPPNEMEWALIQATMPGWRTEPDTMMDVEVNAQCLKQARKILKVLEPWLSPEGLVVVAPEATTEVTKEQIEQALWRGNNAFPDGHGYISRMTTEVMALLDGAPWITPEATTMAELAALPVGTVVMAPSGFAVTLDASYVTGEWMLPAKVLFSPRVTGTGKDN